MEEEEEKEEEEGGREGGRKGGDVCVCSDTSFHSLR